MTDDERQELEELLSMGTMLQKVRWLARPANQEFSSSARHPLIGGAFGIGRFFLGGRVVMSKSGLPSVLYYVAEGRCGAILGAAFGKGEAISAAREVLESFGKTGLRATFDIACEAVRSEQEAEARKAQELIHGEQREASARVRKVHSIPRRRRRLFAESGGKCFYCACDLTIDGSWHIDHKLPKALGGDNDPSNLVVACAPCNLKKRDMTDTEFMAAMKGAA